MLHPFFMNVTVINSIISSLKKGMLQCYMLQCYFINKKLIIKNYFYDSKRCNSVTKILKTIV